MGMLDTINEYNEELKKREITEQEERKKDKAEEASFKQLYETVVEEVIKPFITDKLKELKDAGISATAGRSVDPITYDKKLSVNSFSILNLGGKNFQFDITGTSFERRVLVYCNWSIPNRKSEDRTLYIPIDEITIEVLDKEIANYLKLMLK